jgi:hypothetical protein
MKHAFITLGILGLGLALTAMPGMAREMCGLETFLDEFRAGARHEGASGMCIALQGCSVFSPYVVGHRMKFMRDGTRQQWHLMLSTPEPVDIGEGVVLKVDDGEEMRVPPEFLDEAPAGNGVVIRREVAGTVMQELRKGRLLNWHYVTRKGRAVDVAFPIKPLLPLLDWADCTEKTLNSLAEKMMKGK